MLINTGIFLCGSKLCGERRTGSKFSRHFFNQSEVKPKPIVAHACTFSRALCRLCVITSSFDWFTGLSPSFLIGQSNYFGFGFTTLNWNSLYLGKLRGYPQFSCWISIALIKICVSRIFSKPRKNTFELVGTVLNYLMKSSSLALCAPLCSSNVKTLTSCNRSHVSRS